MASARVSFLLSTAYPMQPEYGFSSVAQRPKGGFGSLDHWRSRPPPAAGRWRRGFGGASPQPPEAPPPVGPDRGRGGGPPQAPLSAKRY